MFMRIIEWYFSVGASVCEHLKSHLVVSSMLSLIIVISCSSVLHFLFFLLLGNGSQRDNRKTLSLQSIVYRRLWCPNTVWIIIIILLWLIAQYLFSDLGRLTLNQRILKSALQWKEKLDKSVKIQRTSMKKALTYILSWQWGKAIECFGARWLRVKFYALFFQRNHLVLFYTKQRDTRKKDCLFI